MAYSLFIHAHDLLKDIIAFSLGRGAPAGLGILG
jgi:hypothetical protein